MKLTMIVNVPEFKKYKDFKGVFVGGCVKRGEGSSFRAQAHAHNSTKCNCLWCTGKLIPQDKKSLEKHQKDLREMKDRFGWICVRSQKRLGEIAPNDDGSLTVIKPSQLLWHELAHILTPNHYHDDAWRKKMKELNQPLKRQYYKQRG